MDRIYASVFGRFLLAGPASVVVTYFHKCPEYVEEWPPGRRLYEIEKVKLYLDRFEYGKDYVSENISVTVEQIDSLGFAKATSRMVAYLVAKLRAEHSINYPVYLCNCTTQYVLDEPIGGLDYKSKYAIYTNWLSKYYSNWWMSYYHHYFFPHYEWNENHGAATSKHFNIVLKYGPVPYMHHKRQLLDIADIWLRMLEERDSWALNQQWLTVAPYWWRMLFPEAHFCHNMGPTKLNRIREIMYEHAITLKKLQLDLPEGTSEFNKTRKDSIAELNSYIKKLDKEKVKVGETRVAETNEKESDNLIIYKNNWILDPDISVKTYQQPIQPFI